MIRIINIELILSIIKMAIVILLCLIFIFSVCFLASIPKGEVGEVLRYKINDILSTRAEKAEQKTKQIKQIITTLENTNSLIPASGLFSATTKTFQLTQLNKISIFSQDYMGATLKVKNLTNKKCNLTTSMFEKIFKKYDLIKFTETILDPSEEALVYLVFKKVSFSFDADENVEYVKINFLLREDFNYITRKTDLKYREFADQLFQENKCSETYSSTAFFSPNICDTLYTELREYRCFKKLLVGFETDLLQANNTFCQE